MSRHNHNLRPTPEPEPEANQVVEPETVEPETQAPVVEAKVPSELESIQQVLDGLDSNSPAYEVIKANLLKLKNELRDSQQAQQRIAFDTDLKALLAENLPALIEKHGIDLSRRKVIITFPDGESPFDYTDVNLTASGSKSKGNDNGFKSQWGKSTLVKGEETTEHESPSALAKALGLRITGHKDMPQVFTKPISAETGEASDIKYTVDAERGVRFIVAQS